MLLKKALQYRAGIIQCCICLIFIVISLPTYTVNNPEVNDSIIGVALWNANYENALRLISQHRQQHASDNNINALLLLKTSELYLRQGNHYLAGKMIAEAEIVKSHITNQGHELQFQYALQKARYLHFVGKDTEILIWLKRGEHQVKFIVESAPGEVAMLYGELGAYYNHLHSNKTSIRYYELAAAMHKSNLLYDKIMTNYYYVCLANVYWNNNEPERAAGLIKSCIDFLNTLTEPLHPALIDTYLTLASGFMNVHDNIPPPESLLQNATLILDKSFPANHFKYAILYYLKSRIDYVKNDYENALIYSLQVLNLSKSYPSLSQYQIYNYKLIAWIYYWYKNDYEKTINSCNLALSDLQHTNQSPADYYYLLGLSYGKLKNYRLAINYFNKVISCDSASRSPEDINMCSRTYLELAIIASSQKKTKQANNYLKEALRASQKVSPKSSRISIIYYELGITYSATNNYQKALSTLQQSIISSCRTFSDTSMFANPVIADIQTTHPLIEALWYKAYILYKLYGNDKKNLNCLRTALDCQELSVKLTERTVMDIDTENASLDRVNLKRIALDNAVSYATLLYLCTDNRQYAEKALVYAEKSKMQVLLINTMKKNDLHRSGLPDSLIRKEERLKHEILDIENRLALDEKSNRLPALHDNLLAKLTGLYDRRDELANRLEKDYPAYYRAKYSLNVAGLDEIQQMLDDDQVILEYQLLDSEIITFVIARNDFSIHYQPIDKQVPDNIQQLRNSIASDPLQFERDSAFKAFAASSHYLYEKLIGPVYDKIKNKRLIIIPHNLLTQIPFEVLISKKPADNQQPDYKSLNYLIKEFSIVYAYSANLLLDQNLGEKYGSGTAIFLPDYTLYKGNKKQPLFPVLKGAASEAAAIKKLSHGRLFKDRQANETNFKARANGYRVLHIASHTLLDDKNPSLSCIVMTATADSAEDGYLYSYELNQMDLNAQLVVLSGCNTGFGILRKSEGLISIARSFFYTGVRTIAYTLWPVADGAGATLISDFYKEVKHHQRLDDALKTSKLKFLEQADPVKAHPFYWAGYVIVGKTDPVPLRKSCLWPGIMLAVLLITLLSVFHYRKFRV